MFSNNPIFYGIYYILSSGGFADACFRSSRKVSSTSMSWADTCDVRVSTTNRPVPHTEDSEGTDVPRSTTDSTEQWVWCFMYMWSMLLYIICLLCVICPLYVVICYMSVTCYMSFICLVLGPSSGSSGSVRIYRRVIFGNQNW